MVTDKNASNKIVSESDANTSNKTALSTEEETVNEGEEVTVKKSQNIKTGDNVYAYIAMFIISGFVIAVVVRKK